MAILGSVCRETKTIPNWLLSSGKKQLYLFGPWRSNKRHKKNIDMIRLGKKILKQDTKVQKIDKIWHLKKCTSKKNYNTVKQANRVENDICYKRVWKAGIQNILRAPRNESEKVSQSKGKVVNNCRQAIHTGGILNRN